MKVIGLISGTSADGIDAALVDITSQDGTLQVSLIEGATYPYPADLRAQILAVCDGQALTLEVLATLDDAIATAFAQAALTLQQTAGPAALIGSHGQTVFHRPLLPHQTLTALRQNSLAYSLQLGRGDLIAWQTGLPTISNFRAADIAAGGEGAPLVPAVDVYLLSHATAHRCIQNLGGIGNVTYLPARGGNPRSPVIGWDTGPANSLLDLAVTQLSQGQMTYDVDGQWAATGEPCQALVDQWLTHPFFQQPPPKSTGRELFGRQYLEQCLADATAHHLTEADTLATLTDLTAASIVHSYTTFLPQSPDQVLLCGGGSHNQYLRQRLQHRLDKIPVLTTDEVGLSSDYKEAVAFAVLAYWRYNDTPGNLPSVTGSRQRVLLGDYFPGKAPSP